MGTEIVTAIVTLFCSTASGVVTFILTKRKYSAEVDSQQIDNMGKSFDIYKKMMEESLEAQKNSMQSEINSLKTGYELVKGENDSLKAQVAQLQMQMLNILGSLCLDSTCKLRKMNFTSDLKFSDSGLELDRG
jgi:FtsZ-binding cell division protein ZapB